MMDAVVSEAYYRRFLRRLRQRRFMKTNRSTKITEIDGMDTTEIEKFPYSSLKLLGGVQIGTGVLVVVLGIVDLFLFLYVYPEYENESLNALTIASVPVWCGLWFIITGSMGACMSMEQKTTLSYFKSTFMVLSLLCAILFAPAVCAVEIYIVIQRTEQTTTAFEWLLPLSITFFGITEIIFAIITCGICCCCSSLNQAKVRVLYARDLDDSPEKPRLETPEIFYTNTSKREPPQVAPIHTERRHRDDPTDYGHRRDDYERDRERAQPGRKQPRVELTSDSPDQLHRSRPPTYDYAQLKRMTFPGDPDRF